MRAPACLSACLCARVVPPPVARRSRSRFGALPKVERKVITKMTNRGALRGLEHTTTCTSEIGGMLSCLEARGWRAGDCTAEIGAMQACVEAHAGDPDPRVMARQWQGALRQRVFQFFAKQRVLGRLR